MRIGDKHYRSIWLDEEDKKSVMIIDQTRLPFKLEILRLRSVEEIFNAIKNMNLRGAPLIGAAGSFGMWLATMEITRQTKPQNFLNNAARWLMSARPTAVNLEWAVKRQLDSLLAEPDSSKLTSLAMKNALSLCDREVENCRLIGDHGISIIEEISKKKNGGRVNILTHCNAGWLACIDWGTVGSPIYQAHDKGIKLHVWVDETRPRNQGARLTAFELSGHGVDHTLITDNAGGHIMQKGMVDLVIVGSDRTTRNGDVANKTGTYLKALAAYDNDVPFYAALPTSSIDLDIGDGLENIRVEERGEEEVTYVEGSFNNDIVSVRICPEGTRACNPGFDITPARLVTGLITERGVCGANEKEILNLFSDK